MDPFSIAASSIAVSQAGASAFKIIRSIASLKKAPALLVHLHREFNELQVLLRYIEAVFPPIHSPDQNEDHPPIRDALKNAKTFALELDSLIEYQLTRPDSQNPLTLDKTAWFRNQGEVQQVRQRLQEVRVQLSVALCAGLWWVLSWLLVLAQAYVV
jgi:hypothetical protein